MAPGRLPLLPCCRVSASGLSADPATLLAGELQKEAVQERTQGRRSALAPVQKTRPPSPSAGCINMDIRGAPGAICHTQETVIIDGPLARSLIIPPPCDPCADAEKQKAGQGVPSGHPAESNG